MQNIFPPRQNIRNLEFAEVLKQAITHLWDGVNDSDDCSLFICGAIMSVKADTDLLRLIAYRLEDCSTLTAYTLKTLKAQGQDLRSLTKETGQANRRSWMLDTLEEFSSRG